MNAHRQRRWGYPSWHNLSFVLGIIYAMDTLLSILLYFPCKFSLDSVNGWIPISAVSCVGRKEGFLMVNMDIFQLFFNYLEERPYNNVYQNVKQDADYLEAAAKETELSQQFKNWIYRMNREKS